MLEKLAINGGSPVRSKLMPPRGLIGQEEKSAVMALFDEAISTGNVIGYNGLPEQQYEKAFVNFMGGGFADGVNSGTNAVYCALGGLQLDAFSEVIVPPITDPGGVMPVVMLGCVPIFADSDLKSYNTSAKQIEPLINERTKAIIVAHIAGEPVDMDPIMSLAKQYGLYVIEDCAQAHGAEYKGKKVGSIGHIAAFSTMFGKHHCTGGQGGVVYSINEDLHWQARRFADRGKPFNIDGAEGNVVAGINCNLNDISAVIGSVQIKKLPSIIDKRRKIGEAVKQGLINNPAVSMGWQVPNTNPVYWFLRFKLDPNTINVDKATFCKALAAEGLSVMESYRNINCEKAWFKNKNVFGKTGFPWNCSDYKGDRNPHFNLDNAVSVTNAHFNISIHENYGDQETHDILKALEKITQAYLKD